jgi:hypothetical protein
LLTGNEPLISIKGGEFLDQLSEHQFYRKDSHSEFYGSEALDIVNFNTIRTINLCVCEMSLYGS